MKTFVFHGFGCPWNAKNQKKHRRIPLELQHISKKKENPCTKGSNIHHATNSFLLQTQSLNEKKHNSKATTHGPQEFQLKPSTNLFKTIKQDNKTQKNAPRPPQKSKPRGPLPSKRAYRYGLAGPSLARECGSLRRSEATEKEAKDGQEAIAKAVEVLKDPGDSGFGARLGEALFCFIKGFGLYFL